MPPIYRDNCHLSATEVSSGECAYGVVDSPVTVVLFGNSHAAQWFPALEQIALERGWRLLSLTKGSCPAADISVWSPSQKRLYTECDEWRASVLERIAQERPALVVISSSRIAGLMISQTETVASQSHDELWGPAVQRMLEKLKRISGHVVLMGDTPNPKGDPSVCLSAHLDDMLACATSAKIATLPRRAATEAQRLGGGRHDLHRPDSVDLPVGPVSGHHRSVPRLPERRSHRDGIRAGPRAVRRRASLPDIP